MTENLYIFDNGTRKQLDLNSPSGITLSFKSVLFGDLSSIAPSSSYTFELPLTTRNKEVLGLVDDIRETKSNFGKKFQCLFLVDGFDLCRNAYLYVDSVKDGVCSAVMTFNVIEGLKKIKDKDVSINELTSNNIEDNPNALIKDGAINMDVIEFLESSAVHDQFDNTKKALKLNFNCGIVDKRTDYQHTSDSGSVELQKVGVDYGVVPIEEYEEEERRIRKLATKDLEEKAIKEIKEAYGIDTHLNGEIPKCSQVLRTSSNECRYVVPANQILHRIEELFGITFDFLEEKKYGEEVLDAMGQSMYDGIDAFYRVHDESADLFNWGVVPIVTTRMSQELEDAMAGKITAKGSRTTEIEGTTDNFLAFDVELGIPIHDYAGGANSSEKDWYEPHLTQTAMSFPYGCEVTIKGRLFNIFDTEISDKTLHLVSVTDDKIYLRENDGDINVYKLKKAESVEWSSIGIGLAAMPHDPVSYFIGNIFGWWTEDNSETLSVQTFEFNDDVFGSPWEIKELDPYRYKHKMPSESPHNWVAPSAMTTYNRSGSYIFALGNSADAQSVSGELKISVNWGEGKTKHWVDIYSCLPDISCLEFVKSLFVMSGAVPVVRRDGSIGRMYYSDLIDNTPSAKDWSSKFIQTENISYREDLAQHNYILMQNEDMKSKNEVKDGDDVFEGNLWNVEIQDKYLEEDKELYKLPFYGRWLKRGNAPQYETGNGACVYQLTKNDLSDYTYYYKFMGFVLGAIPQYIEHQYKVTLEATEMKPIFGLPRELDGTMNIWNVGQDADKHLDAFRKIYSQPSFLNVKMLLSIEDLYDIDYSVPIYLSQFNSYFAIVKIDWHSESGVSDVQLCKIEL